jgi:hypothetical protein
MNLTKRTKVKICIISSLIILPISIPAIIILSTVQKPYPNVSDDTFKPNYATWTGTGTENDISPKLSLTSIKKFDKASIVGKQLGITNGFVNIGFSAELSGTYPACVIVGIDPGTTGNLIFDNIGVTNVDSTVTNDELGAGIIFEDNKRYQLVGTQMLFSDFSRQNTDNGFAR